MRSTRSKGVPSAVSSVISRWQSDKGSGRSLMTHTDGQNWPPAAWATRGYSRLTSTGEYSLWTIW